MAPVLSNHHSFIQVRMNYWALRLDVSLALSGNLYIMRMDSSELMMAVLTAIPLINFPVGLEGRLSG